MSVVIPTYNRAPLLARAIGSALAQSEPVHEILVMDDGSTDETQSVLAARFSAEPRVRPMRLPVRGGACAARNAGIAAATGTHVAFLDSDDEWAPEKIAAQRAAMGASPSAIACFTGLQVMSGGRRTKILLPPLRFRKAALSFENVLGSTSSALVARDALIAAGLFDVSMVSCQDWDLYRRLAELGPFTTIAEPLTLIDDGDHARISRNLAAVLEGRREMARRIERSQPDARAIATLRLHHGFEAADITAQVGGDTIGALRQGLALTTAHPGPAAGWRFAKLAYRTLAKSLRDRAPR